MRKTEQNATIQVAGSTDRDSRGVPYEFGNRRERRKINKQIGKLAANAKRRKKERERGEI